MNSISKPVGQAFDRGGSQGDDHRRRRRRIIVVVHGRGGGGGVGGIPSSAVLVAPLAMDVLELGAQVRVLLGLLLLDQVELVVQQVVRQIGRGLNR